MLAAKGFAASDILLSWPEIVGERLAARTEPLRLDWPREAKGGHAADAGARPQPATLVVRVTGAFALELQHCAPLVIERVNTHFGWRCVGRLALRQGPVRRSASRLPPPPAQDAALMAKVDATVSSVADDGLRAALARLGRGVLSRGRGPGPDGSGA
jgi:hypothetical protein